MVRSLMALVLRRVLAWLVSSDEHAKNLEIVVLRHQLQALRRHAGRPRIRWSDRLFLAAASRHLPRETWHTFLVTPQTVLRWHRELVRRKWSRGTGRRPGRPSLVDGHQPIVGDGQAPEVAQPADRPLDDPAALGSWSRPHVARSAASGHLAARMRSCPGRSS
jgi:hypothetical protein